MADRRISFIQGEIARIHPADKQVTVAHGDLVGDLSYDYLVLALGRRLKTERISGFFEHAHHLLDVESAESFGLALNDFKGGQGVDWPLSRRASIRFLFLRRRSH
jgi:NADH dehydrogenase FAD-containing subunit